MKKINNIMLLTISACIILLSGCDTQQIEIKEVFSRLITRNKEDRVYSGQIKSKAGLAEFEKTYEVELDEIEINFEKQMLIFGITDNISTRAFRLLHNKNKWSFTLDYTDTGIKYKLVIPNQGEKHSYVQVFVLKKIDGIPHVGVKNLSKNGLSKVYDQ